MSGQNAVTPRATRCNSQQHMDTTALPTDGRTWIVGLTGSIGMGKSTVSQMLRTLEVPVNDADAAVHAMYAHGGVAVAPIGEAFPEAVEDGAVSRPKLSKCVVGNSEAMQRLEAIVHPLVKAARDTFLAEVRSSGQLLAVLDIPLLFEKDLQSTCDEVLVVSATAEIQRERVLARPNITLSKFEDILARQVPDDEKRLRANSVIDTACSLEATRAAVCEFVSARRRRKAEQQVSGGEQNKAVLCDAAATVDEEVLCDGAGDAAVVEQQQQQHQPPGVSVHKQKRTNEETEQAALNRAAEVPEQMEPQKKRTRTVQAPNKDACPSLTGTWTVTGQSKSSGAFRYTMTLNEDQGGGDVTGRVATQDMNIAGTIDHATGHFSFTQTIAGKGGKVNTCTAELDKSGLTGGYKSSTGGTGTFKAKRKAR